MPLSKQDDQLPEWEQLTPNLQEAVAKNTLSIKRWKFICLALTAVFAALQPFMNSYKDYLAEERKMEMARIEKVAESNSTLNKVILDNLMSLSTDLSNMKIENLKLKERILELEKDNASLKNQVGGLVPP